MNGTQEISLLSICGKVLYDCLSFFNWTFVGQIFVLCYPVFQG
jgi:hypothetical protein